MEHQLSKTSSARQRAEKMFDKAEQREQRDAEIRAIQRERQDAEAAKLVRLRSLRLAKEATERADASAAKQTGEGPASGPNARKPRPAERN
jgi:hypothetical protein